MDPSMLNTSTLLHLSKPTLPQISNTPLAFPFIGGCRPTSRMGASATSMITTTSPLCGGTDVHQTAEPGDLIVVDAVRLNPVELAGSHLKTTLAAMNCTSAQDLGDMHDDFALLRASQDGDLGGMAAALDAGANIEVRDRPITRPKKVLGSAFGSCHGCSEDFSSPDTPDIRGMTPLMHAAKEARVEPVAMLLLAKADPTVFDEDGVTPLHLAVRAGCFESCRALIAAGAVLDAEDDNGNRPFDMLDQESKSAREIEAWQQLLGTTKGQSCHLRDKKSTIMQALPQKKRIPEPKVNRV
eukprot:TRINITY_DN68313_c0_g1_i1.p1 TRINITY_DN68313_c0_g1~~TRINITY_DN68313_c0_g1_i1.p1  ORF type:complete len:307 (+),score=37.11 TRINITY_DN68313_c0_g1_i1:28-921(+)